MFIVKILAVAIIAYLLGSLNFAIIISKVMLKDDIRNYGSGNAEAQTLTAPWAPKERFW